MEGASCSAAKTDRQVRESRHQLVSFAHHLFRAVRTETIKQAGASLAHTGLRVHCVLAYHLRSECEEKMRFFFPFSFYSLLFFFFLLLLLLSFVFFFFLLLLLLFLLRNKKAIW